MMRHITGESLGDFAALYEPDVELISVTRPAGRQPLASAAAALANMALFSERWSQPVTCLDIPKQKLSQALAEPEAEAIAEEILVASDMLACLLECKEVGIRISTITRPMCPRFHVDRVPCRLLTTLQGTGTEWIANADVDFDVFADRDATREPVKQGRHSRLIPTNEWALLKGGAWAEGFEGVVHRSPGDTKPRVLLSIDPIFD